MGTIQELDDLGADFINRKQATKLIEVMESEECCSDNKNDNHPTADKSSNQENNNIKDNEVEST